MALTDDQKAMLRLLAQREDSYDDMAALMGISVEEVRDRVKEALAEVDETEATAETPAETPTAARPSPPSPAPTPQAPAEEPAPPPVATPPAAPTEEPQAPAPKAPPRKARSAARPPRLPTLKLPKDRGALIGLGAGALVVVIFVVVLIVGGSGGGSSSTTTTSAENGQGTAPAAASENPNLTQAILAPVDGSDSSGVALFGRMKKKVLLQVTAKGLEPSQSGESYAVWLSHSGKAMVPVGTAKVPASGDLAARFQVPAAVIVLVARSAFNEIDLTRTSDASLNTAIAKARKEKSESAYTGTEVLRGKITGPFVGATAKKSQ